jgi:hypothetical protein
MTYFASRFFLDGDSAGFIVGKPMDFHGFRLAGETAAGFGTGIRRLESCRPSQQRS